MHVGVKDAPVEERVGGVLGARVQEEDDAPIAQRALRGGFAQEGSAQCKGVHVPWVEVDALGQVQQGQLRRLHEPMKAGSLEVAARFLRVLLNQLIPEAQCLGVVAPPDAELGIEAPRFLEPGIHVQQQ
jgi:hypothetical protein